MFFNSSFSRILEYLIETFPNEIFIYELVYIYILFLGLLSARV